MHDTAYKLLFSHPRMVEDLLRGFAAVEWSDALDFTSLEKLPAEFTSEDLRRRSGDAAWRVRFRGARRYLLVLLEFQSTVDPFMAVRIQVYSGLLYQDLIARGDVGAGDRLPPVLPIVLYNGRSPWAARVDVADLVAPGGGALARYQPSQRYFVLDAGRHGDDDLPPRNLVSALVRLEASRTPADVKGVVGALVGWLRDPGHEELKRSFGEWIRQVLMPSRFGSTTLPEMPRLEEVQTMLAERVEEWFKEARERGHRQGLEEGREKGRQEGREEGRQEGREEGRQEGREEWREEERTLLCRLAARKFDAEAGERLSGLVDRLTSADELAEVGEWIIECDTGADFLRRASRVVRRSP